MLSLIGFCLDWYLFNSVVGLKVVVIDLPIGVMVWICLWFD